MTFVAVAVVGGFQAYTAYQSGKSQQAMAEYNADIAQNETIAETQRLEAEARQLTKDQRGVKARQRVSVAGRGGLAEGTDLLSMAESARDMQLDQLELLRQQDITKAHGASQVAMYKHQGKQAASTFKWITAGIMGGVQGASMSKSMQGGGGKGGGAGSNSTSMSNAPSGVKAKYGWK